MQKAWYEEKPLRHRVGFITWYFMDFVELKDKETGNYVIIHESKVYLIKNK